MEQRLRAGLGGPPADQAPRATPVGARDLDTRGRRLVPGGAAPRPTGGCARGNCWVALGQRRARAP
eukprot:11198054-Lingulodinium_polyedra.AAC.1